MELHAKSGITVTVTLLLLLTQPQSSQSHGGRSVGVQLNMYVVMREWGAFDSTQDRMGKAMVKILQKAVKDSEGSQQWVTHSYDAKL